jgi:hypothetical protein
MTLGEADDIGKECRATGTAFYFDQTGQKALLAKAGEAIEWLLTELEQAERRHDGFEWGAEP